MAWERIRSLLFGATPVLSEPPEDALEPEAQSVGSARPGAMDMREANNARLESFRKNLRFAAGIRWLGTFDSSGCAVCAALDGAAWDFEGNPIYGTTVEFQMPPLHDGCRCVLTPIPGRKALDEVFPGLADRIEAARDRASREGPVKMDMTGWLQSHPDDARAVLGDERAALFLAGKARLRDMIDASARLLSMDELRSRLHR